MLDVMCIYQKQLELLLRFPNVPDRLPITPVASLAMASTPRLANQPDISFRSWVIVEKYRVCFPNSPSSSISNTQPVTLSLCTSMPQQRLQTIRIRGSYLSLVAEDARSEEVSLSCSTIRDNPLCHTASRSNLIAGCSPPLSNRPSSTPGSNGAYNNAIHFMIRCEPWIMKNLIGSPGSICSPDRQGGSTCFSREMACCLGVRVWPLDAAVRIAYVMACYSN